MKYTPYQVIWILENLVTLKNGEWPDPIRGDVLAVRVKKYISPFIGPCEAAANIESRLDYCGLDGLFLKAYYTWEESREGISKLFSVNEEEIKKGTESALSYISNKWPKDRSYKDFKGHKKATTTSKSR